MCYSWLVVENQGPSDGLVVSEDQGIKFKSCGGRCIFLGLWLHPSLAHFGKFLAFS